MVLLDMGPGTEAPFHSIPDSTIRAVHSEYGQGPGTEAPSHSSPDSTTRQLEPKIDFC